MTSNEFVPTNALEEILLDTHCKRQELNDLLRVLMRELLYVPLLSDPGENGDRIEPLIFHTQGEHHVGVYTAQCRMEEASRQTPFCLSMTGDKLFSWIPTQYGLVINPGLTVGLEIPAKGVKDIYRAFAIKQD